MESLPTEILLKQILMLDYSDIVDLCSVDTRLRMICNENKEYIYKRLLKRDFGFYNSENSSKTIYRLLDDIYNTDSNFTRFSIYEAIKRNDYKRLSNLVDLGFRGRFRNVDITPLEYILSNYKTNAVVTNLSTGTTSVTTRDPRILDLIVDVTLETGDVDIISLRAYTLSTYLSEEYKKKLLTRFKSIINTRKFLSSIQTEYFKDNLQNTMGIIKSIIDKDKLPFLIPKPIDIVEAIKIDDISSLKEMLNNQKYTQDDLNTSLSLAILKKNIDLVDLLLKNGSDIHYDNERLLKDAVNGSSVDIIRYLIDNGADVVGVIDSLLRRIIKRSRYDVIEMILKSQVSLNNANPKLIQELFKMFRRKVREDLIELLESKGFTNEHPIRWF
jgi:hypothetical protein